MAGVGTAKELFCEAKRYMPGGVNSPVRSFRAVGGYPVFVKKAFGSKIYGECAAHPSAERRETRKRSGEGEGFIDYCMSWGALILGHAHPKVTEALSRAVRKGTSFGTATRLETELAELIVQAVPSIRRVRLTNSGTEAVMGAIRLARAYTGKDKIIKFEGAYHGHADYLLAAPRAVPHSGTGARARASSGRPSLGIPASLGVPKDFVKHTVVVPYNNIERAEEAAKTYRKDLAAIIVEPVMANCGVVLPKPGFLLGLRALADKYNVVLIFDEVITGFRLSYGGAQGYFNVTPDLTCLGKIVGGGLPVGAFGGRREFMRLLAPEGGVYQAGTLSGNPIAVTAGITTLDILKNDNPYPALEKRTREFCAKLDEAALRSGLKIKVNHVGSMFSIFFADREASDFSSSEAQCPGLFKKFFHGLLKRGVYFSPSGFEADFLSTAHSAEDLDRTLRSVESVFNSLRR